MNKLVLAGLLKDSDRLDPRLERLLETGVDEMSWDDMDNDKFDWPSVKAVAEYRKKVHDLVVGLIQTAELTLPLNLSNPLWSIVMGCEHDHIHLETSSVLIRQLPLSAVKKPKTWTYAPANLSSPPPTNELLEVNGGEVVLGKPIDFPYFGWDNEYGYQRVQVEDFRCSKFLVSNGEFLPFVQEGGYETERFWIGKDGDDEGWRWLCFRRAKHPSFWVNTNPAGCGCGLPDWAYQKDCRPLPSSDLSSHLPPNINPDPSASTSHVNGNINGTINANGKVHEDTYERTQDTKKTHTTHTTHTTNTTHISNTGQCSTCSTCRGIGQWR
eukprot:TRINITY_DN3284_c0_g1_i4.p1 TRINITY_DN3284_c0_g1~~TRINITY_DN3284_c0_g1_i4.p1  ORF type:complete len:326 (-),score=69.56 TRINITY_DN3284_c0_g1_i4:510-1487(-)